MGATRYFNSIISADSHVLEPYDLWWNAIGSQYGDRTPRVLDEHNGQKGSYFYSGNKGAPVSPIRDLSDTAHAVAVEARDKGLEEGGYRPEVRIQFQEMAEIRAEVLNPTQILTVLRNPE